MDLCLVLLYVSCYDSPNITKVSYLSMPGAAYIELLEQVTAKKYFNTKIILRNQNLKTEDLNKLLAAIKAWPDLADNLTVLDIRNGPRAELAFDLDRLTDKPQPRATDNVFIILKLSGFPKLAELHLERTFLVRLELSNLPKLAFLYISGNPSALRIEHDMPVEEWKKVVTDTETQATKIEITAVAPVFIKQEDAELQDAQGRLENGNLDTPSFAAHKKKGLSFSSLFTSSCCSIRPRNVS